MAGRTYTAGRFVLQLDGSDIGFLVSVEGGEAFGEVVEDDPVGVRVGKHIGDVEYAPIVVEAGASMTDTFYDWVAAMLDGSQSAKGGAILLLDYDYKEQSRLEWKSALITEVAFPAADASSKESARMRVTIAPRGTQTVAGSGAKYQSKSVAKVQKAFLRSNFRLAVSGLEPAVKKVSKVAPIVVRRGGDPAVETDGESGATDVLDVADLVFWLPVSEAAPLAAWFEDFVIKGNNDPKNERTGTLAFLDPSLKNEVMRIELEGLGIFRVAHERQEDGSGALARVKVEMYCEAVRLADVAGTPEPTPPPAAPVSATVESLASALVAALRAGSVPAVPTADAIADRLLAMAEQQPSGDERDRGRAAGRAWAGEHARLDELADVAALAEREDWTALALAEGHSLVAFLVTSGDLGEDEIGPIDLRRDEFTSGLADGAAETYRQVAPRLRERRPPPT